MWYIVQPWDSLYMISLRYGVSINQILQFNPTAYCTLYIGQRLFIPISRSRPIKYCVYIVEVGDTLDSIAQKFNTTKQRIIQLNNLSSDFIVPGLEMKIETRSDIQNRKSNNFN